MPNLELFRGMTGDDILEILNRKWIRPNRHGEIYFGERQFERVIAFGADRRRKKAFAVRVMVTVPKEAKVARCATQGVPDTVVITTPKPLRAQVLEMHVRTLRDGFGEFEQVQGEWEIRRFLELI